MRYFQHREYNYRHYDVNMGKMNSAEEEWQKFPWRNSMHTGLGVWMYLWQAIAPKINSRRSSIYLFHRHYSLLRITQALCWVQGQKAKRWPSIYCAHECWGDHCNFCVCVCSCVDFPGGTSGKEPACQCRRRERRGFDPWVRKIPWKREWQPTKVFLPGESHEQRNLAGYGP